MDLTESTKDVSLSDNHSRKTEERHSWHPYIQTLTESDVESCVNLENATFPEQERCSREKFIYRLAKCAELSLGIFSTAVPGSSLNEASTSTSSHATDTTKSDHKRVLLGHLVATKCRFRTVDDDSMALPPNWETGAEPKHLGHQDEARTLAVQSLAVLPNYQGRGLGTILMNSYIQRMSDAGIADRIALLTHDQLIPFYESCGLKLLGKSKAQFGGGGWYDMVLEFDDLGPSTLPIIE
ncbi:MAG: hypothetical protein M1812_002991 [Candelaria pacifica]|nr:MAG: hypothetical protein M1812_002991 [Candelaria pacifica]